MAPLLLRALLSDLYKYVPHPFKAAVTSFVFATITINTIACAAMLNTKLNAVYIYNTSTKIVPMFVTDQSMGPFKPGGCNTACTI